MSFRSRFLFPPSRRLLSFVVLSGAAIAAHAADWRHALVQSVSAASAVDPAADVECIPKADGIEHRVAVVVYRVGKSHYVRALPIAAGDEFAVHDEVLVDPSACLITPMPKDPPRP